MEKPHTQAPHYTQADLHIAVERIKRLNEEYPSLSVELALKYLIKAQIEADASEASIFVNKAIEVLKTVPLELGHELSMLKDIAADIEKPLPQAPQPRYSQADLLTAIERIKRLHDEYPGSSLKSALNYLNQAKFEADESKAHELIKKAIEVLKTVPLKLGHEFALLEDIAADYDRAAKLEKVEKLVEALNEKTESDALYRTVIGKMAPRSSLEEALERIQAARKGDSPNDNLKFAWAAVNFAKIITDRELQKSILHLLDHLMAVYEQASKEARAKPAKISPALAQAIGKAPGGFKPGALPKPAAVAKKATINTIINHSNSVVSITYGSDSKVIIPESSLYPFFDQLPLDGKTIISIGSSWKWQLTADEDNMLKLVEQQDIPRRPSEVIKSKVSADSPVIITINERGEISLSKSE